MVDLYFLPGPHVTVTATKEPVVIWSGEHNAWWGPNKSGYYTDPAKIGHYTVIEAIHATHHVGPEKMVRIEDSPELPVDPRDAVVAAAAKLEHVLAELDLVMLPDDTVLTVCASFRDALRAALKRLGR